MLTHGMEQKGLAESSPKVGADRDRTRRGDFDSIEHNNFSPTPSNQKVDVHGIGLIHRIKHGPATVGLDGHAMHQSHSDEISDPNEKRVGAQSNVVQQQQQ